MAYSALIDDLEKQFAENPRRVFARLANEYRKAGDLERAIAYCRAHIPNAPSYISGYIVLGQALYESQRFEESRQAFETALNLDPENLIALRQLGDIARNGGDNESARAWYTRLLEVDPQNEEVLAQMSALAPQPRAESAGSFWPSDNSIGWNEVMHSDVASPGVQSHDVPAIEAHQPIGFETHEPAAESLPAEPSMSMHGDGVAEHEPLDELAGEAELLTPEAYLSPTESEQQLPSIDELAFSPEPVASMESPAIDSSIEHHEPESLAGTESSMESAFMAGDLGDLARHMDANDPRSESPSSEPSIDETFAQPVAESQSDSEAEQPIEEHVVAPTYDPFIGRALDEEVETPSAPAFVTETMADLYLQQGFTGEALAIYRQLVEQNPDDESLRRRLAEVEAQASPASASIAEPSEVDLRRSNARRVFSALAMRRAPANGASRNGAHAGQPSLFGDLDVVASDEDAARRLSSAFGTHRSAVDSDSLDLLFGDSASVNESPNVSESASEYARGGAELTFDEFFAGGEATVAREEHAPAREDADEPETSRSDLDAFHAWLGGLKK